MLTKLLSDRNVTTAYAWLYRIDQFFSAQKQWRYHRYMDDFLILCKTRWQLRRAVKQLNRFLNLFGFNQHPDKTFIGRVEKGFDWLGYQFDHTGVTGPAARALSKFLLNIRNLQGGRKCGFCREPKIHRLYEQARHATPAQQTEIAQRVADYKTRWQRWLLAGLPDEITRVLQSMTTQRITSLVPGSS